MSAMKPAEFPMRAAALTAAAIFAIAAVAPTAHAETGGPSPQATKDDVAAAPPQPPQASDDYADTDPSALTDFRDQLDPYGQWTQDPTYGTIWVPDAAQVGADFAPYQTAGQWALSDDGDWMWQSDYAWGSIPFHYGRWVWAGSYWGWIPGRRYAPAWVTWRVGEAGYVGWAPLPPTWYWGAGGVAVGLWAVPYAAYCFVPTNYAFYRGVSAFVVRDRGMVQSIAATTRPYRPATPGVAHAGRHGHMSPSLSEAHIPASASPSTRAGGDARALAYATRGSTAAARAGIAPGAGYAHPGAYQGQRMNAWHGSYYPRSNHGGSPGLRTPGYSPYHAPSFHGGPAYGGAPAYHGVPHYSMPTSGGYHPAPAAPSSHAASSARSSGGARSGGGGHHR
jgi:hypothetical protein